MLDWQSLEAILAGEAPAETLRAMHVSGALGEALPEVEALFGVPQASASHPEVDSGVHVLLVLGQACALSTDVAVRLGALVHDLGKATTPRDLWPSHKGHEARGAALADALLARLGAPEELRRFGAFAARFHGLVHDVATATETEIAELARVADAVGIADVADKLALVALADTRGRTGFETVAYPQAELLRSRVQAHGQATATLDQRAPTCGAEDVHSSSAKTAK